jgi:DNA-binding SARP family transcriptional activator
MADGEHELRIQILGPVRVWLGAEEVPLGAGRLRGVLALLALARGRPVPRDELVDVLWAGRSPASATNMLQTYVKRLRRAVDTQRAARQASRVLPTVGAGYALAVEPEAVDALRFRDLVASARTADPAAALDALRAALDLWHGPPLADVPGLATHPRIAVLVEERWAAAADLVDVGLALRLGARVLAIAEEAAEARPMDERIHARLIRTYLAVGRRSDGFTAYHRVRRRLVDDLGVDPGPELTGAHGELLRDPGPVVPTGPDGHLLVLDRATEVLGQAMDRFLEALDVLSRLASDRSQPFPGPGRAP